jgi:vitamin B12 transporter
MVAGLDHQSYSGRDDVLLIADRTESVNAAYFQIRSAEEWSDNTQLAAGVRYSKQDEVDGMVLWNLSGKHFFNEKFYARGNIGTAFRLPDAWQLYGNDPCCTQGNPELEGEESFNINLAIGATNSVGGGQFTWELIGFHRTIDNLIGSEDGIRINTDNEVTISGGEAVLSYASDNDWSTTVDLTLSNAEANGGDQQIPNIPELALKWLLEYAPSGKQYGVNGSLLYIGDVYSDVGGFFADGSFAEHGNYASVDLSGHYFFDSDQKHRVVLRLENAFDEDYATSVRRASSDAGESYLYDNLGVPRTLHLTYRYKF